MAIVANPQAFQAILTIFSLYAIARAASKPKKKALETGKPSTLVERGSQLPLLIGRGKLGPLFAWEGNRRAELESSTSGGKGIGADGNNPGQNEVIFADGAHFISVGPGWRLRSIKENGEKIWPLPGDHPNGVTRLSHPSGTSFVTTTPEGAGSTYGTFKVYWGDSVPANNWVELAIATGVNSVWPFVFGVHWTNKRLGGAGVWGVLEYDVEVQPYAVLGGGSDPWVANGTAISNNASHTKTVLQYFGPNPPELRSNLWIEGNHTDTAGGSGLFKTGTRFQLRDSLVGLDGEYEADESVWEPTTSVNYDNLATGLIIPWNLTTWTLTNVLLNGSATGLPGFQISLPDDRIWLLTPNNDNLDWSVSAAINTNPDNATPTNGTAGNQYGTDVNSLTLYVDLANLTGTLGSGTNTLDFSFGSVAVPTAGIQLYPANGQWQWRYHPDSGPYRVSNPPALWVTEFARYGTSTWHKLVMNFKCPLAGVGSITPTSVFNWTIKCAGLALLNSVPIKIAIVTTTGPNLVNFTTFARRGPDIPPIVGITRIYTSGFLEIGIPGRGTVTPYILEPDGTAGANPAHIINQLMFERDPHGLGRNPAQWDIDSLEQLGLDYNELRAHTLVEQRIPIKQSLADLCNDFGIEVRWNPIIGKFGFKKRRAESPFAVIPRDMLVEELAGRNRKLESDPARSFVFTWDEAKFSYSKGSLEIDDLGNIFSTARAGAETIDLTTVKDADMAQVLAGYRAAYELSRGAIVNMRLKNDAATLMPGDVIDVEAITDVDVPFRVLTTSRQPLESTVSLAGFFDHMNIEDAVALGINGARNFPPGEPEQPEEDYAVATVQQPDNSYLFLRIPSHPEALSAYLMVTTDGSSYWTIGTVPGCAGGPLLEDFAISGDIEDGFLFQQPAGEFASALPQLPAGAVIEGVMRLITEGREIVYFRELESLGLNIWRVKGMLRAQQGTSEVDLFEGDKIWIWLNDAMPSFINNLPTTGSPGYKLVPYTNRRVADVSLITNNPIVP